VLNKTPTTILRRDDTSIPVKTSNPQATAKVADVIGSAALIVSTNEAEVPWNPTLVAQKPKVKQSPANTKYLVSLFVSRDLTTIGESFRRDDDGDDGAS